MHKIVVKLGTSTLTQGTKQLSRRAMLEIARQVAHLQEKGKQVVLVTSGAVAAGRECLGHPTVERFWPSKQMFAAVGQSRLMQIWADLFSIFHIQVGQLLLTRDDFSNRQRYLNIRDSLHCMLKHRILPIINENDTIATKEIRVGDNDNLAALVSNLIAADRLILLTDQEGLYTADPRLDNQAALIPRINHIDEKIFALAGGASASLGLGTGGMYTKVQAAQLASQSGTSTVITSFKHPNVLLDIADGHAIGTFFMAETTARESRKRWLLSEKHQGKIQIDAGAEQKLRHNGASLLPIGITQTFQSFDRGALVQLVSLSGYPIAVGITNYKSQDIQKLIGTHSQHIEDILGYSYGPEIIHRDNMTRTRFKEDS
ncbi:glutamate 5-kinase [Candidatus Protochlamydia phocaeensis]|uniref:glutamate 5-kinase n=1 Tax=Candidatus Protochlamydia phocaeensis TaxID=1414722 RepID=UPI000838568F|nr:glutamate 5-kinase [Candidatus Protochlamydia phocaeensis]